MNNQEIHNLVNKILNDLNINSIPIPIEDIVNKYNIRISKAPSEEFSGILIRKENRALIGINDEEPINRQRFSIAHELGHFLLHKNKFAFVDYREKKDVLIHNHKEREANIFAAAILMPEKPLKDDLKEKKYEITEYDVQELAHKYQVSYQAMQIRLINLGK